MGRFLDIHSVEDQTSYRNGLINSLSREFEKVEVKDTLVISSEHLHSRLYHVDEIVALKDFLAHWVDEFQVVLYLRRQDRVAMSLYSTKVKSGNPKPIVFNAIKPGPLPYYFDYESIYKQWTEVFDAEVVTVRLFEQTELVGGDLLHDFAVATGIELAGELPVAENESLSQEGTDFLLAVNRLFKQGDVITSDASRQKIVRHVVQSCKGRPNNVARAEAQAFYEHFRESNERLRQTVFPDRGQSLFDEDFDSYSEEAANLEPEYEDAVRLAIRLLQSAND